MTPQQLATPAHVMVPLDEWEKMQEFKRTTTSQITFLLGHILTGGSDYLSGQQARDFLGVSPATMHGLMINGVIDSIKPEGGHRRYLTQSCIDYLTKRKMTREEIDRRFVELLSGKRQKK